jgi:hypothetical protein
MTKTKEEFNLSEKSECFGEDGEYIGRGYMEEDVKEFIRLLKEELSKSSVNSSQPTNIRMRAIFNEKIDKLAGKELSI